MNRIVIRPRIQIPIMVVLFTVWTLLGVTYFSADAVAKRAWFGLVLGCVLVTSGVAGIWRALRLGVVIDSGGVRVRGFDSRDKVTPWSAIQSVDCAQVDVRAGLPLYAPVLRLGDDADAAIPLSALGSYSRQDAERKVQQLLKLKHASRDPDRDAEVDA
ncbi:PH domain-containing protein [Asanoa sp. NPDC049518]|uniref:PH domain-containing protein n=1 Tax=unclassified Asanoa TaxID=2685164 RepID=UPI00343BED35